MHVQDRELVRPELRVWERMVGWMGRSRPAETVAEVAEPVVNGFFRGKERLISGWILDLQNPERKHDVEIFVGGKRIGVARGDRFDGLVQSHHGGDGNYAFAIYYNGELTGPLEAKVVDSESGTELRSKQPMVSRNAVSGPPLEIHRLALGKTAEIQGRIGAYPWGNALSLEIWSGRDRVVSSIPIIGSQAEGTFTAHLDDLALHYLLSGDVEIALPGLKEAGLAVPVPRVQMLASLTEHENSLRVQLTGNFEQAGPLPIQLRYWNGKNTVEEEVSTSSRVIEIRKPAGFDLARSAIEILYCGTAIRTHIEWPVLEDVQFRTVGQSSSPWRTTGNAAIENGFFAFPDALADEYSASGHLAHLARVSGSDALVLAQEIRELPGGKDSASITVFARSAKKAQVKARLRDRDGILSESTATTRSDQEWSVLRVDLANAREISTGLTFEVEASGRQVSDLDVALGNSRRIENAAAPTASENLLRNPELQDWPSGPGIRQHAMFGEICGGWKVINRGTPSPVYTRATMHPVDGNLGLAVAATEVSPFLRLEAELSGEDLDTRPLQLRFRAGATLAATRMLERHVEPVSQFAVVDRILVVRRTRLTTSSSFEERDDIVAVFARKLPMTREIERFEFESMAADAPDVEISDDMDVEESFHLVFDFRNPTAISLFDVEVTALEQSEQVADTPGLVVEDRNIQLQIETLKSVVHWRGPTPVRIASDRQPAAPAPLKWSPREPVTIVIPVFNALSETLACLESLNGSTTVPIHVRVVDDGSDQTVREALEEHARDKPWVQVRSLERNKGYTFAADFGIRSADTEWVVLLNSDTLVTRGWLEGMLACASSNPNVAFVGPLSNAASYQSVPELYDASRKWKVNRLPPGMTPEDMASLVRRVSLRDYPEVPLLNGFCTLMRRSVFIGLGGLNSTAFPAGYGEENDLCLRAGKAGVALAVADDVYVYHVKSASFGNARRQELTKHGNEALRKLHPEIDIGLLTASFRETPALVAVRRAIAAELAHPDGTTRECEAPDESGDPTRLDNQGKTPQLQKA